MLSHSPVEPPPPTRPLLTSAPQPPLLLSKIDLEDSLLDSYISAGAVAITLLSGLLQGLLLCCFPNYRHFCVAELVKPRLLMDATAFPQIYQRDDGGRLHLGVLLPGFEDRNNLIMTVRCFDISPGKCST
jgi:hypothetical protein